jgi:hypothetical protein
MRKFCFLVCFIISAWSVNAQNNYWSKHLSAGAITKGKAANRLSFPKSFQLFDLDPAPLQQALYSITGKNAVAQTTTIVLPSADGNLETFEVVEASNFEPALQDQFPGIRAFSGNGISDKYATLKISVSPEGIQAMVFRTDRENEFIEAYSADTRVYAVFTSQRTPSQLPWACSTPEQNLANSLGQQVNGISLTGRSGGDLKTMRLAQSVTAEYSNYFGATSASQVGLVLAAINATLTRCNGVYEKDLALHLNLVAASTNVIYYNAATDPYAAASTGASGAWNSQLQSTLTSVIGEANYDIGHLFGASGGGGNAGCIGCICTNGSKGSGYTSPADGIPQGDNFDIDYVVHEIGHQLGANHTFSSSNEGSGVNKEVGSGITIMGYAGITSQDVAPHSIDVYHQASIAQIQANLATKTCPVTTSISATNATPVVAAVSNFTIPKSTPFALTGSATDANAGDILTYSWEQNDNASSTQTGASSVASATKASGPNWISYSPSASPTRLFPKLSTILAGGLISGPLTGGDAGANTEALSSVARTLNFRLTVRDNAPYRSTAPVKVGQTQFTNMVVTVSSASGPFAVTAPNTAVTWAGGSAQNVTWSVASTTAAPVSCANVKITLSTDGGQTFPTVLAASTPNDGTESVVIPATATTTARIKIEAVGNIFFDISNSNFTIGAAVACGSPAGLTSSAIGNNTATLGWNAVSGTNNYTVDYKLNSSATWTNFATSQTATTANLTGLTQGSLYDWRVRANCASGSGTYSSAQFTTTAPFICNAATGLAASAITATSATLSWSAVTGAASYAVSYKLNSATAWTSAGAAVTTTSVSISGLTGGTLYNYRVQTNCGANGNSGFATAQFTTLVASVCGTAFEPNETQASAAAIISGVTNSAAITTATDNDYYKITTTATSNIVYNLVGPSGVDYDMTIFNSAGTQIGAGAGATSTETVTLNNQVAGTYFIRIFSFNGASSATCYTIKATATAVYASCQSALDAGTNGTRPGAAVIPYNTNVTGLINPSADIDHYKFTITTAGTITITLTNLPADYDLKLLNSAGTQVASSANSSTTAETITYTAAAGIYYAQVFGYNNANNATACYTLRVQLGTATKQEDLLLTNSKPVLHVFPNPALSLLLVDIKGTSSLNSTLKVIDAKGVVVMQQRIFKNPQPIDVSKLAPGFYSIQYYNGATVMTEKFIKQ